MNSSDPGACDVEDESAISTLSKECLKEYEDLCSSLRNTNSEDSKQNGYDRGLALRAVEDAKVQFKAWATNIAAFQKGFLRSSLDFRLKEAAEIRRRILKVLGNLNESLIDASSIVSGLEPNETWDVGAISDSEDEAPAKSSEIERTSDFDELIKAIKAANISLMKMSMVIRNSPSRDDYLKAATRYSFDPRYDIGHVMEKHGSAKRSSDWLLERLGKAITRRRQYLKYREDHHGKLTRDWEEAPATPEVKLDLQEEKPPTTIAHTKATTFVENVVLPEVPDGEELGGSFGGSQTSYEATMIGEGTEIRLTVPQHPKMAFEGVPFEFGSPFQCPYCYTEQTVRNRAAWKNHVFRDLKPYVCTFRQCDLRMFRSRSEWFAHEVQIHRREWTCPRCELGPFDNIESFQNHLIKIHSSPSGSQLEALVLQSEEPVDKISSTACKLCDDWETNLLDSKHNSRRLFLNDGHIVEPYGTLHQFRRHLGRHMEQLALFALPKSDGDEMEDDSADSDDDGEENLDKAVEDFGSKLDQSDHSDQRSNNDLPSNSKESPGSTLWLLNLPESVTIANLRSQFEPYATVIGANVFNYAKCGLVTFENGREALSVNRQLYRTRDRPWGCLLSFNKPAELISMHEANFKKYTSYIWDDMELGIGIDESSLEGHISSFLLETFGTGIPTRKLLDAVTQYGLPRRLTPDEKNEIRVRASRNRKVITKDPEASPDDLISGEKTSSTEPRIVHLTQDLKQDLSILESRKIKIPPGFISSLEKQYFRAFDDPEASGYIDPVAKRTFLEACGGLERQDLHKMGDSGYFEGLILEFFQYTIATRFGVSQKRKVSQLVATFVRMIKLILILDYRSTYETVINDLDILESKLNIRYLAPTGYQNPEIPENSDQESDSVSQLAGEDSKAANRDNGRSISQVEKSGTKLFMATNDVLDTLTQWSQNDATDYQVLEVYNRLSYEIDMACRSFQAVGLDTSDIDNAQNLLGGVLEATLNHEASVEILEKYLPRTRDIIINLLQVVKQKQQTVRQKRTKNFKLQSQEQISSTNTNPPAGKGTVPLMPSLVDPRASVIQKDAFRNTPLWVAARNGDVSTLKSVLENNPPRNDGSLHEAARKLYPDAVNLLIKAGHDVNFPSPKHGGRSPLGELCYACKGYKDLEGLYKTLNVLAAAKADPLRKFRGRTALFMAMENPDPIPLVTALLEVCFWKDLNDPNNIYEEGDYFYSPTIYIKKGIIEQPEATANEILRKLQNYNATDRYYAKESIQQPADAIGMPLRLRDLEHDRQINLRRPIEENIFEGKLKRADEEMANQQLLEERQDWGALQVHFEEVHMPPSAVPFKAEDEVEKSEEKRTESESIYRCDICGKSLPPGSVWTCRECDSAYCEDCRTIESSRSEEATLRQSHRHVLYRPEPRTLPDLPGWYPSTPLPVSVNPSSAQSIETPPTDSRNIRSARPTTPSWADFLSSSFVGASENANKRREQEESRKTRSSTLNKASSRTEFTDEENLHAPTNDDSEDIDEDVPVLGREPSQQLRMASFQFEPVSLPASRVPSDEGSSDGEEVDFDTGRDSPVFPPIDTEDARGKGIL